MEFGRPRQLGPLPQPVTALSPRSLPISLHGSFLSGAEGPIVPNLGRRAHACPELVGMLCDNLIPSHLGPPLALGLFASFPISWHRANTGSLFGNERPSPGKADYRGSAHSNPRASPAAACAGRSCKLGMALPLLHG